MIKFTFSRHVHIWMLSFNDVKVQKLVCDWHHSQQWCNLFIQWSNVVQWKTKWFSEGSRVEPVLEQFCWWKDLWGWSWRPVTFAAAVTNPRERSFQQYYATNLCTIHEALKLKLQNCFLLLKDHCQLTIHHSVFVYCPLSFIKLLNVSSCIFYVKHLERHYICTTYDSYVVSSVLPWHLWRVSS